MQADVLIIGGGPVGALLARLLGGASLRVVLAESQPLEAAAPNLSLQADPRMYAVSSASRELLERVAAWSPAIAEKSGVFRSMTVWDRNGTGQIDFQAENAGFVALGHIVAHRDLLAALWTGLSEQENLQLASGEHLEALISPSAEGPGVRFVSGLEVRARLLIAADGPASTLRQLAGLRSWYRDYRQFATVALIRFACPHADTARQVFLDTGPLALLPLAAADCCALIWSADDPEAERLQHLDDSAFAAALHEALEGRLGAVLDVGPRKRFPLHRSLAKSWVKPGIALVGDAAHCIHPLAGQGLNIGFADVSLLAKLLLRAHPDQIGDLSLLRRYQHRRMPVAVAAIAILEAFQLGFQLQGPQFRWLRNLLLRAADDSELLKARIMAVASGMYG